MKFIYSHLKMGILVGSFVVDDDGDIVDTEEEAISDAKSAIDEFINN